ncbi:bifunctional UDP-3-O-[3-hydroxymyristoyl] N-acetylglucosamine deacetylase/3-hydroxyacyl-ACP dehydratase [candidate division KSB1 bacterium]
MEINQKTIKKEISISGTGLHTGTQSTITFKPAPPNSGIYFLRTDLSEKVNIPADIDHVVDISRGTTLAANGAKVHTVEHLLAAITGLEIDNICIEINGMEPPVGDGSAIHFVNALLEAGFEEQDEIKDFLVIDQTIQYLDEERGVHLVALPTDDLRITVMIDYMNPALGSQHSGMFSLEKEFVSEFASARTFCFLSEVDELTKQGLIKGGSLKSAVVIVDKDLSQKELEGLKDRLALEEKVFIGNSGILNDVELRYNNEPARHKVLDLLGDLALIGTPIKAQILAARSGHKGNIEFVKQIRKLYKKQMTKKYQSIKKMGVIFDQNAIKSILPHRYPFLLVDKIIELEPGKKIVGVKNVTVNEPFFVGHFPGNPVMPGVLIVEAMGQTGGLMLLNSSDTPEENIVYLMGLDKVRFRKPVVPGDQLVMEMILLVGKKSFCKMSGKAFVNGEVVCEMEIMAALGKKQ